MEPLRTSLSIIMPVFNHRDEVRTMIDSILANDFNAWELLAVDDGSGEDTLQLLESYAAVDSRIRVVRRSRQPKGAHTCRNMGLEMARGEFVIVFDSDDYIAPYCLRQRVEMLQKRTDLDFMVFPSGVYVDERFLTEPHPYAFGFRVAEDDVALFASRRLPFIVWNNIYRTESLRRHNLTWNVNLLSLQDADFNISAIAAGLRYDYAEAPQDYGYRIITTSSISKKINTQAHVDSHVRANSRMYDTVRRIGGKRYDRSLYDGMLRIYNSGMTGKGINRSLADALADSVRSRNRSHSRLLKLQICLTLLLQKILPARLARQLPVAASKPELAENAMVAGYEAGSTSTFEDLLHVMLVYSANDAAYEVAVAVAGSEDSFVQMMNDKATELGMDHTHFENPHGLDADGHHSTVHDLAILARYAMTTQPFIADTVRMTSTTVNVNGAQETFPTVDHLLGEYDGLIGIKTGAGNYVTAFMGCARRHGTTLYTVVLGCTTREGRFTDTESLLDWAFGTYDSYTLASPKTVVAKRPFAYDLALSCPVAAHATTTGLVWPDAGPTTYVRTMSFAGQLLAPG